MFAAASFSTEDEWPTGLLPSSLEGAAAGAGIALPGFGVMQPSGVDASLRWLPSRGDANGAVALTGCGAVQVRELPYACC